MIKKGLQPLGVLAFLTISVIFLYVLLFRSLARSHAPASRKEHMRPNSTRHLRGPLPTGRALTRRQAVLCCDRPRSLFLPGQLSSFIHCSITPCYCAARELFTKAEARLLNRPSPNKLLFKRMQTPAELEGEAEALEVQAVELERLGLLTAAQVKSTAGQIAAGSCLRSAAASR